MFFKMLVSISVNYFLRLVFVSLSCLQVHSTVSAFKSSSAGANVSGYIRQLTQIKETITVLDLENPISHVCAFTYSKP